MVLALPQTVLGEKTASPNLTIDEAQQNKSSRKNEEKTRAENLLTIKQEKIWKPNLAMT